MDTCLRELSSSAAPVVFTRELLFTGDFSAMIASRDRVMDFIHEHCVSEQEEVDILVALQEGLVNAVLHGCNSDPSKVIRCVVEITPEAISIVITDPGQGFDISATVKSAEDATNLTEHGRGILLMRSLMDEVSYRRGGAELLLKKRRPPRSP